MEALAKNRPTAELLEDSPENEFSPDELHERLITFTPDWLEYDEAVERPVVEIVSDTAIRVGGEEIELNSSQLFFLNALRIYQGHPMMRSEITDMGYQRSDENFRTRANNLLAKFASVSDVPIVVVTTQVDGRGKPSIYELLPEVEIRDMREVSTANNKRGLAEFDDNGHVSIGELGSVRFKSVTSRSRATALMLTEFGGDSQFNRGFHRFFTAIGQRSNDMRILPLVTDERLGHEEEQELLAQKEKALIAFLEADEYTTEERMTIVNGVDAFYALFARNADMLESFGHKYATSYGLRFDDSYQRCAEVLLDTIARTGFDASGQTLELRLRTVAAIKRAFHPSQRAEDFSAATIGSKTMESYMSAIRSLNQSAHEVSDEAIADVMGVSRLTVKALRAALYKADFEDEGSANERNVEPDFVDEELDRIEREDTLADLLASDELTMREKQVISLRYGLFCSALSGAEIAITKDGHIVEYPRTRESFEELAGSLKNLDDIARFMNNTPSVVRKEHRLALAKARIVLQDNPAFDTYGRVSPRQIQEETQERMALIQKAMEISPGEVLLEQSIRQFTTISRIDYLFGSVAEFQLQCGFVSDKKAIMSRLSNAEIIERARRANPEGKALRRGRLEQLAIEGVLPRQRTIISRFGSTAEFNRQCGFAD